MTDTGTVEQGQEAIYSLPGPTSSNQTSSHGGKQLPHVFNVSKCHNQDLVWLKWGNAKKAWNLDSKYPYPFSLRQRLLSLCQRGACLGWETDRILSVIAEWPGVKLI